jgi:uncharacterized protein YegL
MDSVVKFTLAVIILCPALIAANLLDDAEDAMQEAVTLIEDDYAASDGSTEYQGCEYYDACDNPPQSSTSGDQIPDWLTSGTPYHALCNDSTPAESYPESPDCAAADRSCSLDVSYDRATSYFTADTDFESQTVKQATCVLRDLDLQFQDFSNVLDVDSYAEYLYASVGGTGGLTSYPGTAWSCPSSYNALFRPWYPTAAIGPKNVILIIDASGSMSGSRMDLAKAAAIRVLDTLSEYDYVGLVYFSRTASKYADTLKPFTSNEACLLEDYINDLRIGTTTNYEAAFTAAFDIFDSSVESGDFVNCSNTNAMLFLTDGEITEGSSGSTLYNMIKTRNPKVDVRILTYALGSGVDTSVTQQIAYDNKGAAYSISDNDDLSSVMASYYDLFVGTVVPETVVPVWIKYREFNSGEFVSTVCLSAYDLPYYEENGVSQLLGVVCADLIEEHIFDVMGSLNDLNMRLNATASQCPRFEDPTEEQLNLIRSNMAGSPHVYTTTTTTTGAEATTTQEWRRDELAGAGNKYLSFTGAVASVLALIIRAY